MPATLRSARRLSSGERGSVSLELTILTPVLILLIFAVVQAGLFFYARSLAMGAAQEGVAAGRAYQATPGAGAARARAFLDRTAKDSLTGITVDRAGSTTTEVQITVTGRALSVFPGVPGPSVRQSAHGPVERFTTAGGTP